MSGDDAAHIGQSDACSGKFLCALQSAEGAKKRAVFSHVKPHSVVLQGVNLPAVLVHIPAKADLRFRRLGAELPGIANQVFQHLAQKKRVAIGDQVGLNLYQQGPAGFSFPVSRNHFGCHGAQVHAFPGQGVVRGLGHQQHRIYQADHVRDACSDTRHVVRGTLAGRARKVSGRGAKFLGEQGAEAIDGGKRGAQVVRNRVRKGFEFLVGGEQLGGFARLQISQLAQLSRAGLHLFFQRTALVLEKITQLLQAQQVARTQRQFFEVDRFKQKILGTGGEAGQASFAV